jgi:hypothetical protein
MWNRNIIAMSPEVWGSPLKQIRAKKSTKMWESGGRREHRLSTKYKVKRTKQKVKRTKEGIRLWALGI